MLHGNRRPPLDKRKRPLRSPTGGALYSPRAMARPLAHFWQRWSIPIIAGIVVAIVSAFLSLLLPNDWRWLFLLHLGRRHDYGQLIFPGPVPIAMGFLTRRLLRRYLQGARTAGRRPVDR